MRAFVGIDFSTETKAAISQLQNQLRGEATKGRWKYHDNFHLTLKFFSEIEDLQKNRIDNIARQVCSQYQAFRLSIGELGVFDGRDSIRVLWLGLKGDINTLGKLFGQLEEGFHSLGFEKEKRSFKPHVTIGQELVFKCPIEEIKSMGSQFQIPEIYVDKLQLFKSEQIGSKRVYTKIEEYRLLGEI